MCCHCDAWGVRSVAWGRVIGYAPPRSEEVQEPCPLRHIRRIGEGKLDEAGQKKYPARRWVVERTLGGGVLTDTIKHMEDGEEGEVRLRLSDFLRLETFHHFVGTVVALSLRSTFEMDDSPSIGP